jgi:hypothetical protein
MTTSDANLAKVLAKKYAIAGFRYLEQAFGKGGVVSATRNNFEDDLLNQPSDIL